MTHLQQPKVTEEKHRANQIAGISDQSKTRMCYGPRCRNGSGQTRSVKQFQNERGTDFSTCKLCRGVR